MGKKLVLLDTNFLASVMKFKISLDRMEDVLQEAYEFLIPARVLEELKKISPRHELFAKRLIESGRARLLPSEEESVDKELVRLSQKLGKGRVVIATNDKVLRKKLRKIGVRCVFVKGKKYFRVE